MTKNNHPDVVNESHHNIVMYVDFEEKVDLQSLSTIGNVKQLVAGFDFHFSIESLINKNLPTSMLVLCQSTEHAMLLTKKYGLEGYHVYWLLEDPEASTAQHSSVNHWFVDGSNANALLPTLSLLTQNKRLCGDKQNSEAKLALLSECMGELSLTLSKDGKIVELNAELVSLMGDAGTAAIGQDFLTSLPIPSVASKGRMQTILSDLHRTHSMTRLPPFPIQLEDNIIMLDGFIGPLHNNNMLLTLRQIANWQNHDWPAQHAANKPVSLLLINPDNFAFFNQEYGRDAGDKALTEIMQSMAELLRCADFANRYSGAVFAAHLPETNEQQAQVIASRMSQILRKKQFSDKKVNLEFSFGLATLEPEEQLGEQSPFELFRRANAALQAARSIGGGKLVSWQPQFDANILANLDRMSGKFSDAPEDDFRLITLQWDLIQLIGNTHSLQAFTEQVCKLLTSGMHCEYAGIYLQQGTGLFNIAYDDFNENVDVSGIHQWVNQNIKLPELNKPQNVGLKEFGSLYQGLIPLTTRGQCLGAIVIRWHLDDKYMATKCHEQLSQVTPNLAAAIDRIMLLKQDRARQEKVDKKKSDGHELLFESASMQSLMQQVQMVAPTDVTVLITGESGTGKEVIARQVHDNSLLADKPFITLDCSTIVEHLIESELFGHRKGAFTGATSDQPGMIAQADGGTLFLDEVGELPLDIQSKLLRFVQEKTYVAVGEQRVRKVDVRLVLATNRNLPDEVARGRFRADLYYRINVFTLSLPPLQQREGDILLLSRHFLTKFSKYYNKPVNDITSSGLEKLIQYNWPGNVRELRNCIMRAIILSPGNYLDSEHLVLQATSTQQAISTQQEPQFNPQSAKQNTPSSAPVIDSDNISGDFTGDITALLEKVIEVAIQQPKLFAISDWLEKQWIDLCLTKWGSLYQVALQIEQSESTLRRRSTKLNASVIDYPQLVELTDECKALLDHFLEQETNKNVWHSIVSIMHKAVISQQATQQVKAKLLNVTQPTLRKITQQLQD